MNKEQIKEAMNKLDLSKEEMAELMGITERTVYRWINGDHVINNTAQLLLKCWLRFNDLNIRWKHESIRDSMNLESENL